MKAKKSRKRAPAVEVTADERYHLINDAAYFRTLQQQPESKNPAGQAQAWCAVEAEIDAILKKHHAR